PGVRAADPRAPGFAANPAPCDEKNAIARVRAGSNSWRAEGSDLIANAGKNACTWGSHPVQQNQLESALHECVSRHAYPDPQLRRATRERRRQAGRPDGLGEVVPR